MRKDINTLDLNKTKTTDLLESPNSPVYVSPDDNVLLVGPGILGDESCGFGPMDPGLITLACHLSKGTGNLTVLDLNPEDKLGGDKDWEAVKLQMDKWADSGAKFAPYFFIEGNILSPPKSLKTYDKIIDHHTWAFATKSRWGGYGEKVPQYKLMSDLAKSYSSLLDDRGRLICYFVGIESKRVSLLVHSLLKQNICSTQHLGLEDTYELKDPTILKHYDYLRLTDGQMEGNYMKPWYKADGFILAQKC